MKQYAGRDYEPGKAMDVVPAFFSKDFEANEAFAQVEGATACAIQLPKLGACIFNVDGTLEPCNALIYEHMWCWKTEKARRLT